VSASNYTEAGDESFDMIVRGAGFASLSDSQRVFAFHVGSEMLEERWLLGVGTNAYRSRVLEAYGYAPDYVLLSIHGEFWRVLVENGAIGLLLYGLIWLAAVYRLIKMLAWLNRIGVIDSRTARMLFLLILLPMGFSVAFEAAGTHAFVALLVASYSPEILYYAFRRSARSAPRLSR
jgi:O-antigen ligase